MGGIFLNYRVIYDPSGLRRWHKIFINSPHVKYPKEAVIVEQGQRPAHLYFIINRLVEYVLGSEKGEENLIGFSQIDTPDNYKYLDDPIFRPFWAELEKLDVPFYMHPREPHPENLKQMQGHPWLEGAAWAFGVETATHTLRLMCSGVFDEFPKLKYILGHLGETLSFCIWRAQNRINKTGRGIPAKRPLPDYIQDNMWYTTSGQYHTSSLLNAMMEFDSDRVLFATDFPFETVEDACVWFDNCTISENDRYKIGRENAIKLLKLNL